MTVLVVHGTIAPKPFAPTLLSPPNGVYQDLSGTPTFAWTYNPGQAGNTQTAWEFVLLTNGSSTPQYWNVGTVSFQSSPVWNSGSIQSYTFPSASFSSGSVYQWTVATQDANGKGPAASLWLVNSQSAPAVTVTAPTGTVVTADPTIKWGASYAPGSTQTGYRVVIYTAAQYGAGGFTPGSGPSVFDTGLLGSAYVAQLALSSIPFYLANSTSYRAYVMVTETGGQASAWAYSSFSVAFTAPATPVISAATGTDPYTGAPLIALTVSGSDNLLSTDDADPTLGIGSWHDKTNAVVTSTGSGLKLDSVASGTMAAETAIGAAGYPVVAGSEYSAIASFTTAASTRSCTVAIAWYSAGTMALGGYGTAQYGGVAYGGSLDVTGSTLISTSTGTPITDASTTKATVTATAPAGAAYATVVVTVASTGGASEIHYVTEAGLFVGTNTTWTPGGFSGLGDLIVQRSDLFYVRGASINNPAVVPMGASEVLLFDYEAVPITDYTYDATIIMTVGGNTVLSDPATSNDVTLITTNWWEINPVEVGGAINAQAIEWSAQVTEQSTAHLVMGQQTPNIVANVMGGTDGTATFETFDPDTYAAFQAILQSQATIFVSSPFGPADTCYARFGPQTGGLSSGTGNKVKESALMPSAYAGMHRTTAVTWVAQSRPPV